MKEIPLYLIDVNDNEKAGICLISNTSTPAIRQKGVAFSTENQTVAFSDNEKMRIIAPILTPGRVYRNDENGEYFLESTPETIERVAYNFNKFAEKQAFNINHTEEMIDAYLSENWIVEHENDKANVVYGLNVAVGSWVGVQQFNSKEDFEKAKKEGLVGFSIQGKLAFVPNGIVNFNQTNMNQKQFENKIVIFNEAGEIVEIKEVEQAEGVVENYSKDEIDEKINAILEALAVMNEKISEKTEEKKEENDNVELSEVQKKINRILNLK